MAYNTPETVADYLARFQMEITHRGKGTFTPDHVKYSLTIASGGKDFFTTFESNPHVHGEPTITQVFGALSRFALPENRKAALNMIRKLNESRDSNDNAL